MQTCNIMGVNIAVTDMDKTLRLVEDNCEAWRGNISAWRTSTPP